MNAGYAGFVRLIDAAASIAGLRRDTGIPRRGRDVLQRRKGRPPVIVKTVPMADS
ncbi:hypothetical protein [Paenibacillus ehimensis]|uniref:Transposase n=1 Tax=Paenibacillus ehimensis TaxID=79264 RepID=A0ABT8VKX1_9BACL|nr:hypothetical protein [Paenibacillus ehimensis]MDO3681591.1 hypothetical protein [Paenibacillus ehimensis]